jgi:hypothetical protein
MRQGYTTSDFSSSDNSERIKKKEDYVCGQPAPAETTMNYYLK